jgi:hypothetical protein
VVLLSALRRGRHMARPLMAPVPAILHETGARKHSEITESSGQLLLLAERVATTHDGDPRVSQAEAGAHPQIRVERHEASALFTAALSGRNPRHTDTQPME